MEMCSGADNSGEIKYKMKKWSRFSDKGKNFGLLFIRLIISWRLIAGIWTYISTKKQISEVVLILILYMYQYHLPVLIFQSIYNSFVPSYTPSVYGSGLLQV